MFTESKMQQMNRSNGICQICNLHTETLCHLLIDCVCIKPLWSCIENVLFNITNHNIELSNDVIILGVKYDMKHIEFLYNFFILNTKWIIWKNRNSVRYGKNKSLQYKVLESKVISYCKDRISTILQSVIQHKIEDDLITLFQSCLEYE